MGRYANLVRKKKEERHRVREYRGKRQEGNDEKRVAGSSRSKGKRQPPLKEGGDGMGGER